MQNLRGRAFGLNWNGAVDNGGVTNPGFANPFQNLNVAGPAGIYPNKFPFVPPAAGATPNFSTYTPFALSQYNPTFRSPYSDNVQLTITTHFPPPPIPPHPHFSTF